MNEIPADLVLLDIEPKNLSNEDLEKIIYCRWFLISESRIGTAIGISELEVGPLDCQLLDLQDGGFSFKNCKIEEVPNDEKKWSENEFYTDLTRKFNR